MPIEFEIVEIDTTRQQDRQTATAATADRSGQTWLSSELDELQGCPGDAAAWEAFAARRGRTFGAVRQRWDELHPKPAGAARRRRPNYS